MMANSSVIFLMAASKLLFHSFHEKKIIEALQIFPPIIQPTTSTQRRRRPPPPTEMNWTLDSLERKH